MQLGRRTAKCHGFLTEAAVRQSTPRHLIPTPSLTERKEGSVTESLSGVSC